MFWNNMNVSIFTKFCINKEAFLLLVSQAARLSQPSWPVSLPSLTIALPPFLGHVCHRDGSQQLYSVKSIF